MTTQKAYVMLILIMIPQAEVTGQRHIVTISGLSATSVSQHAFVAPSTDAKYKVVSVSARFKTASTSGTLNVEVAKTTVATGSGTNQLGTALSLSGTADVTVNGQVTNPTIFDYTSVLNLIFAGTMTSLADCVVSILLERVN